MEHYTFILYVAGDGELSSRARANFDRLIAARLLGRFTLTVVDILAEPAAARRNRVVATPLLVRDRPPPLVKILGDLSQEATILARLGLDRDPPAPGRLDGPMPEEGP